MPREISGTLDGSGLRLGVVVARFNAFITEGLLGGALQALGECRVRAEDITIVRVPGAFEVALAARAIAEKMSIDAIVCLAAVIRGDTPHFEYVSKAATDGVGQVMLELGVPVAFGVLTTNTVEQAVERSSVGAGNKGAEAARTAVEMATLLRGLR